MIELSTILKKESGTKYVKFRAPELDTMPKIEPFGFSARPLEKGLYFLSKVVIII